MKPEYLYLHVPFCTRRCSYCDFAVDAVSDPPVVPWLDAVERELRTVGEAEGWAGPLALKTIYVGGGTPSLLGEGAMAALRRRLEPLATWGEEVEWTVEANPESFGESLARDWRDAGVNRISLGAQSFQEKVLRWMGRLHGPTGPVRALEAARSAGIENCSIDLIFGLPARLERDWGADLRAALALEPEHISLYGLTAEPSTPLGRWVREGRERLADEDGYAEEFLLAAERLSGAGYRHYEVSNFACEGRESRHNGAYWTGASYLGLGPGAHSYLPPERRWNLRDWNAYRSRIVAGESAVAETERVEGETSRLERIWLGLRQAEGLRFGGGSAGQVQLADRWVATGWAEAIPGGVRLTPAGWLLLDRLAVDFDDAATSGA